MKSWFSSKYVAIPLVLIPQGVALFVLYLLLDLKALHDELKQLVSLGRRTGDMLIKNAIAKLFTGF